eukprot:TRINITY_DN4371_c0_g1_i1.p1 TRINITY_DN4371_c0_g1~~TRINITY_DN4371_c0_g1_i1.p1  ORF type:complete len:433 (+),score=97.46 TRINITY_DN4371_c0_g1_i1:107-1405(+)
MEEENFLSERGSRLAPSFIRHLTKYVTVPGMLNLGGGLPNPTLSPLTKLSFTLENGQSISFEGAELNQMLLFSPSLGRPELLEWIRTYMEGEHGRNFQDEDLISCITSGSQDALQRAVDLLLQEGDSVLVERYTYSGTLAALKPLDCNLIEIDVDEHGIVPSHLKQVLDNWKTSANSKFKFPKVLYVVPTGQNPTGATLPNDRRRQIYDIACDHNLLILEDDPYYWLQFEDSPGYNQLKSFFSMDKGKNRVIRFDSFSKVFCTGFRVGWVTGPRKYVQRIGYNLEAGAQSASTVPQLLIYNTVKSLGHEGWMKHVKKVQRFYMHQREVILKAAEKHLTGLAEWASPSAGMFIWFKLLGVEDCNDLVSRDAIEKLILLVPGSAFAPSYYTAGSEKVEKPKCPYLRASFSNSTPEQLEEAIKRLADILKEKAKK